VRRVASPALDLQAEEEARKYVSRVHAKLASPFASERDVYRDSVTFAWTAELASDRVLLGALAEFGKMLRKAHSRGDSSIEIANATRALLARHDLV
jgi:hypothetical protein